MFPLSLTRPYIKAYPRLFVKGVFYLTSSQAHKQHKTKQKQKQKLTNKQTNKQTTSSHPDGTKSHIFSTAHIFFHGPKGGV